MKAKIVRASLLFVFSAITSLQAYTFSHAVNEESGKVSVQRWHSSDLRVSYYLNQGGYSRIDNATLVTIVQNCFSTWQNNPLCGLSFNYMEPTAHSTVGSDGYNLVIFDSQTTDGFKVAQKAGASTIGLTWRTYYTDTGEIADADIIFNEEFTFSATEKTDLGRKLINLKDVLTHEIGHLVGLNHTYLENATMWPYAADGQASLAADDSAGAGALYPTDLFSTSRDSITGVVKDFDGNPLFGIFVSAIPVGSTDESISALCLEGGHYCIAGLRKDVSYRLRARSVDLAHLDTYEETHGSSEVFIPQYFNGVTRLDDAQTLPSGSLGVDFTMSVATVLARHDAQYSGITVLSFPGDISDNCYYAVRFPSADLPAAFTVFGMQFWNNDYAMFWPRIMLCEDVSGKPNLQNVLRQVVNFQGKEKDFSLVEWENITLTNGRDLWVVFQLPNKQLADVGDGPALGAENGGTFFNSLYYSTNGGSTFTKYQTSQPYDPLVSLTVGLTTAPIPVAQLATANLDFGVTKIKQTATIPLLVTNPGTGELTIGNSITSSNAAFSAVMGDYRVPAGGTDSILVRFLPKVSYATYNAQLTLTTNDPARTSLNVLVKGRGAWPKAQVSVTPIDFGAVETGQSVTRVLNIKSTGDVVLYAYKFALSGGPFSLSAADTLRIAAGDSAGLSLTFSPLVPGPASTRLSFSVDDSLASAFNISLSGSGTGPAVVRSCDFSGDGRPGLTDAVAFLLLARSAPGDPRLDWNEDGLYSLADVLALVRDIRAETCPSVSLAASEGKNDQTFLAGLSRDDIDYLRRALQSVSLSQPEREAFDALLDGAGAPSQLPRVFALAQNSPNPFNPRTAITFSVPEGAGATPVTLVVFDIRGQIVRTLVDSPREPGSHTVYWEGEDDSGRRVPSGIYLYRLRADGQAFTRKMVLLK
ncbi:choice-of-anchor D domain-containing protein [bacterium]|nr:choice-of-anchor D domain-containing protein [bacterium]